MTSAVFDATTTSVPRPASSRRRRVVPETAAQSVIWLVVTVVAVGPLLPLLYASVRSKPIYQAGGVFTMAPYRQLFSDPAYWKAVRNTLVFSVMATVLAVALGAVFAVLCHRTTMRFARTFGVLLLAPIVLPPLGLMVGWTSIYGDSGYVTTFLSKNLHLPTWQLSSLPGMSVLGATVFLPIAFLTCRAALDGTDSALEDAARGAGASSITVIRRITLPLLRPAILNSAILVFALSFEALGIPLILGQSAHIDLYASYLYHGWQNSPTPDPAFVSAGAVVLIVFITSLLLLRGALLGSAQRYVSVSGRRGGGHKPLDLGRFGPIATAVVGGYVFLTAIVPLVGLLLMSFVQVLSTLIPPWQLITGDNWRVVLDDPSLHKAIVNSLLLAGVGAFVTVAVGALATFVAHRSGFSLRAALGPTLMFPRAVPGIALGIGFFWTYLMFTPGSLVRNNLWGELIVLTVRNLTLAYIVIYPTMARIGTDLDHAARASGAGWAQTCRRIVAPLLRPAVIGAYILVFISILNEFDALVFLTKPGTQVMSVTMLQNFTRGVAGPVAALAIIQTLIVASVLVVGVVGLLRSRRRA
jgi:iron(III) transport system permease protein